MYIRKYNMLNRVIFYGHCLRKKYLLYVYAFLKGHSVYAYNIWIFYNTHIKCVRNQFWAKCVPTKNN